MNMKKTLLTLLTLFALCATTTAARNTDYEGPRPAPHQLKWHEAELGVVFHYDLHVFDGLVYGQGNNRINPIEDYNIFHPDQLDTDQWIQSAKAAGAKFAILTATHETGFGLWQSDVNPYCMKALKWRDGKGDIVPAASTVCNRASTSASVGTPCWVSTTSRQKVKVSLPATVRSGTSVCAKRW